MCATLLQHRRLVIPEEFMQKFGSVLLNLFFDW